MTLDDALKFEAGLELDCLIGETVFGLRIIKGLRLTKADVEFANRDNPSFDESRVRYVTEVPGYSKDIAAAWLVVEALIDEGIRVEWNDLWCCKIGHTPANHLNDPPDPETWDYSADADTAPLAICRAALRACWKD